MGWHRPTGPTVRGARSNRVSVGVIGGGIGGLSAALSLLQAGLVDRVYEQAPTLGEVGAGINLSPTPPACCTTSGWLSSWPGPG
jgi:heterodisulfide reductase subunit A-like polyferredoxin